MLPTDAVSKTVQAPSLLHYEELRTGYASTLQCPCSEVSVKYAEFLVMNTTYHQVCSSDFVQEFWIIYLFADADWARYERTDIRVRGGAYFRFLSTLCQLTQTTISNTLTEFLAETFIIGQAIPDEEFVARITSIIQQFQNSAILQFLHALQLVHDITHSNTFISSYMLNWNFWLIDNSTEVSLLTRPVTMDDGKCSCGTRNDCTEQAMVYNRWDTEVDFVVPGWNVGCSVANTLTGSTLECLHDQACIDELTNYLTVLEADAFGDIDVIAMNPSMTSRFLPNTPIQNIINELFVERWYINASYAAFYWQCAPTHCLYSVEERKNALYVASQILGLYGGLTVSIRFIIPHITALFFKVKRHFGINTVHPIA